MAEMQQSPRKQIPEEVEETWGKQQELPPEQRLNSAFEHIPLADFPDLTKAPLVEVRSDASIRDAVRTLAEHNLLSAPVVDVDAAEDAGWMDRYLGLVESAAIVLWVLSKAEAAAAGIIAAASGTGAAAGALIGAVGALALGAPPVGLAAAAALASVGAGAAGGLGVSISGPGTSGPQAAASMGGEFFEALTESGFYRESKVKDIVGSFRWAPFLPVRPADSLLTVLLLLSKYRMKSLPVVETGDREIKGLISQIGVIHMLSQCSGYSWFDSVGKRKLQELSLPVMKQEEVVKVSEDDPVLDAFKQMSEHGFGGIPVVASGGGNKLVGNISTRDILILLTSPRAFKEYKRFTVGNFLEAARTHLQEQGLDSPLGRPPVTCCATDTLKDVINKLDEARIHRIYVVSDEGHQLQGVVTLRDIISKFVVEPDGYFGDFFQEVVPQKKST